MVKHPQWIIELVMVEIELLFFLRIINLLQPTWWPTMLDLKHLNSYFC